MYLQRPSIKSKSVHNDRKLSLVLYHTRNYTIPLTNNFIDDIIRKMMMPQQCYSNINVLTYFIAVISSSPVYMYGDTIYCDITVLNKPFMDVIFFQKFIINIIQVPIWCTCQQVIYRNTNSTVISFAILLRYCKQNLAIHTFFIRII